MTEKLYYQDVYIKEFTAKGINQLQDSDGNWYITLTETAFYPTGGGQPSDIGTLNSVNVVNVEEVEGELRHYLEEKIPSIEQVRGVIDWERRFDHMQQHSGQHILTAAFVELFGLETVSFHLGRETATIDIKTEALTDDLIARVERRANEIIRENRPIETKWVTKEEAKEYDLRKQLSVTEDIRLAIIPDYDYNGCGGTHPSSTGQIGSIKILDWEKHRNNARVQFVCGDRVLKQLQQKNAILLELSRLLSAPEGEMIHAVQRVLDTSRESAKTVDELKEQLLQFEADELVRSIKDVHGEKVISRVFDNRTVKQLQKLAKILTNQLEDVNLFFVTENNSQIQFVCARGSSARINMKTLVKRILPLINGKGGGNESMAQGGGEAVISGEELLHEISNIIEEVGV